MVKYRIVILKSAQKDKEKIRQYPALQKNVANLLELMKENPFANPPSYEKLQGDFRGLYSRRINRQHRLVYRVLEEEKTIMIGGRTTKTKEAWKSRSEERLLLCQKKEEKTMKINWKVRVKSPQFWIGLVGVIASPILAYLGLGFD